MRTLPAWQYVRDINVLVMKMKWGHIRILYKSTDEYLFKKILKLYWMVNVHFLLLSVCTGGPVSQTALWVANLTLLVPLKVQ
jgi:hypothetical protein